MICRLFKIILIICRCCLTKIYLSFSSLSSSLVAVNFGLDFRVLKKIDYFNICHLKVVSVKGPIIPLLHSNIFCDITSSLCLLKYALFIL